MERLFGQTGSDDVSGVTVTWAEYLAAQQRSAARAIRRISMGIFGEATPDEERAQDEDHAIMAAFVRDQLRRQQR